MNKDFLKHTLFYNSFLRHTVRLKLDDFTTNWNSPHLLIHCLQIWSLPVELHNARGPE